MQDKKKTTPKQGSAKTQSGDSTVSKIPKISPPRGFTSKDDKKIQEATSSIHESTHQFPSEAIKEVLNVLKVVERQFDKLRDEQKKQEGVYDELIQKIQVIEKAESKLNGERQKLDSDRKKTAETDKIALEMIEEHQQILLQNEKQFQSEHQSSVRELEKQRSELEQESKSLHAERDSLIQDKEKVKNKAHEQSQIIEELQNKGGKNETQTASLHDRISQLEADLTERESVIATLSEQAKSASEQEMTAQQAVLVSELPSLRDRVVELESELAAALEASVGPMNEPNDTPGANFEKIKANLQEVAIHLHRRQERLHRARRLVRESRQTPTQVNPQATPAQTREEEADLKRWVQNQRQRLAHEQTRLKDMESRMIRMWAPRNAALVVSALGLLLAILVVASWLTTSYVFPARNSASVTLKPKTRTLDPLTEEQTAGWQLWHAELVQDEEFKKTLLKRMRDRQMSVVETIDLDKYLEERLSLDTGMPGELTMTLSGTRKQEITDLLDVITSTVLIESNRQIKKRTDGAFATASNERKASGISRYAVINPTAIQDHRKFWMAPIFLLYGILAFGVFRFVLKQMTQVKRVINEEVIDENDSDIFNDNVQTPY